MDIVADPLLYREQRITEMLMVLGLEANDQRRDYVARLMDAGHGMVEIRRDIRRSFDP